jgi:hypothetical protein
LTARKRATSSRTLTLSAVTFIFELGTS